MAKAAARYYRDNPCCGGAPVWNDPSTPRGAWVNDHYSSGLTWGGLYTPYGGPLSDVEVAAIKAIEGYGGTYTSGRSPLPVPGQTRYDFQNGSGDVRMDAGVPSGWGAPYDRNVPRITSAQQVPSLPDPEKFDPYGRPQNSGLPHAQQTLDYQERERVRVTPTPAIRAVWDETAGHHVAQILWCESCGPDAMEQFVANLAVLGSDMVPVVRGIAMVCSYVPVFGTAVSFVLNVAMNLADGEKIGAATVEAIGAALPGQPMAGMAFDAAVAIILGESANEVVINGMPDPPASPVIKKGLIASSDIMLSVISGETITNAALDELAKNLPPRAAQVLDIARRMANGENVEAIAIDVLGKEAANAMTHAAVAASESGSGAVSRFASEAAFQAVADTLPEAMRDAFKAGFTVAIAKRLQDNLMTQGFATAETAPATNNALAAKGQQLMATGVAEGGKPTGITWHDSTNSARRVQDIRNGSKLTLNMTVIDTMSGAATQQVVTDNIDDTWRRGFDVAIGLCDGMSANGPGQEKTRASLTLLHAQGGFDMGQAIQFGRTFKKKWEGAKVVFAPVKGNAAAIRALDLTPQQPTYLKTTTPDAFTDAGQLALMQKKTAARGLWVAHYEQLASQAGGKMSG